MGVRLRQAPVFLVVAQARFNDILSVNEYVPKIQDELRGAGYPIYSTDSEQSYVLDGDPLTTTAALRQVVDTVHRFTDLSRKASCTLAKNFVSFKTTDYDCFETFTAEVVRVILLINGHLKVPRIEKLGFRMLDAVVPEDQTELELFLHPSVHGIPAAIDAPSWSCTHTQSETRLLTEDHVVLGRVWISNGPLNPPAHLRLGDLKLKDDLSNFSGLHAIIDFDCVHEDEVGLSSDEIVLRLRKQKDDLKTCFNSVVTEYALDKWK